MKPDEQLAEQLLDTKKSERPKVIGYTCFCFAGVLESSFHEARMNAGRSPG